MAKIIKLASGHTIRISRVRDFHEMGTCLILPPGFPENRRVPNPLEEQGFLKIPWWEDADILRLEGFDFPLDVSDDEVLKDAILSVSKTTFAELLKAARKIHRLTQAETAKALDLSPRTYWEYESGAVTPPSIAQEGALARLSQLIPK